MPMMGLGTRFASSGLVYPKPLIPVNGKPMFYHALDSFKDISDGFDYHFIVREEHIENGIDKAILDYNSKSVITVLNINTFGSADSVLLAGHSLNRNSPLLIMDCDIFFTGDEYLSLLKSKHWESDCILGTFISNEDRFSYVEYASDGKIAGVVEKQVVSSTAIAGTYFFRNSGRFLDVASDLKLNFNAESGNEMYISRIVNSIIKEGGTALLKEIDFTSMGTPDELDKYLTKIGKRT
jgi:NDP-sugar pyrophosphorylase family protein